MLDTFRRKASGWILKVLFLILAFSFVLWGIPHDYMRFGTSSLATVGSTQISPEAFRQAYQDQLSAIARQSGQRVTPEQARAFGLDRNVLSQLVNSAAIANEAKKLDLSLSDAALVEGLRNDPDFRGPDGKFSRAGLENILRQVGMSEQGFLALRRRDELQEQILSALTNAIAPSKALIDRLHAYREERRVIAHLTIDPARAEKPAEPDEAKLKETYEQNKARFTTPEYRHLAVLVMGLDQVKDRASVTDEAVKAAYEKDKESYDEPEKRRVQQIGFKDLAAAQEAKKAVDGGKGFTDVAKDQGASLTDIELGLLTKKQLIDPKIAEVAFSIEKDKVSDPVEGRFTTVLLRVSEIQPGKRRTLEDVKDKVRDKLFKENAAPVLHELADEVEDARIAGKTLKDIAASKNLKFVDVPAASAKNLAPDGKRALDLPEGDATEIIQAAFAAGVGVETEVVELADGGSAWVDPIGVTEPREKPFEEVKDEVKTLAIENEQKRLLNELGAKLADRVKGGETLDAIAKDYGGQPATTAPITRAAVVPGLTEDAIKQAFGLPKDGAGSSVSEDEKSRTVFKVVEVKAVEPPSKEQADRLADELRQQIRNDALNGYVEALKTRQSVSVNEAALARLTGAEAGQ